MFGITPTRRRFMEYAGAGAVIASAGSAILSGATAAGQTGPKAEGQPMPGGVRLPDTPPQKAKDSVGIAIVGLGGYALRQIMPGIVASKRTHVAGVVSGNAEKAATVANAYGVPESSVYSYDNFDAIADDASIEAVYIILPSGLHADWTEKAFAAGKHVLCEKPMALTSDECQRMIAAGKAAKKKLMIGYRCHFEPYNVKAMELMREGAVGRIRMIRAAQHYNMGPTSPETNWRVNRALAGGGPLEDYGIYGVQSALYLAGEAPAFVSAHTTSLPDDPRFAEIFAHVATQFKFPSGAVAQLSTSYNAAGLNNTVVHGENEILDMEPATGYGGQRMTLGSQVLTPGDPSTQFAGQMDHFANAVRDNATIKTGGAMGLRDVRLMEAIYKSAAEKTTIALAPDGSML